MPKITYDDAKEEYLKHAKDKQVLRKLSPSHILGIKKLDLEERKLNLAKDMLEAKVLKSFLGSAKVIEGEVLKTGPLEEIVDGITSEITGGSEES